MAAITKIEFWSDVGFIDGAVEIPRLAAADPTSPNVVIEPDDPIMPSKDRFFTELKLKEYYTGLLTMSYMRITYDLKNSLGIDTPNVFYGWIDKVELSSDGEYPMTVISWHIDEWRTWKSAITFGSGHVKRRPYKDLATTPIQNYSQRYRKLGSTDIPILEFPKTSTNRSFCWVFLSVNHKDSYNNTITRLYTYPTFLDGSLLYYDGYDLTETPPVHKTLWGPSLDQIYEGYLDERLASRLGVTPEAINGVWISPLGLYTYQSGVGTSSDPLIAGNIPIYTISGTLAIINVFNQRSVTGTKTFTEITSSEEEMFCITSTDGVKLLDLPYGYGVSGVDYTLVLEPDGPYFELSCKNSTYGNLEGMVANIPLTSLPMNSNAYTSYVYSGKQEYDREMRTVQSNSNAWKNTATGAGQGAMMGSFGPQGLVIGTLGGMVGGLTSYGVEMLYQNDEEQRLEDRLQANQPSSLILSSNSILSMLRNYGFRIKSVVPDSYSATQITNTRAQFGVSVDELLSSCDTLIRTTSPTGYYNIQNMIVNGNVPVSAKKWIREKFRSGVRLI